MLLLGNKLNKILNSSCTYVSKLYPMWCDECLLRLNFELDGSAPAWFQSYLHGRSQYVRRGVLGSSSVQLICGVPQGSVLGSILFIIYIADLIALTNKHGFCPHLYADDTQIYDSTRHSAVNDLERRLSASIDDVYKWIQSNRLQLNTSKTELLWCATTRRQHLLNGPHLESALTPSLHRRLCETSASLLTPISACSRTSNGLSPAASLFCGNFVASDDQFHRLCFRRWSSPSCCSG